MIRDALPLRWDDRRALVADLTVAIEIAAALFLGIFLLARL